MPPASHPAFTPLTLRSTHLSAEVCRHGAHLFSCADSEGRPLLFLSAQSHFSDGKAIRGGVPVIAPWFGPLEDVADAPSHGLLRTLAWELLEINEASAKFGVTFPANPWWNGEAKATFSVTLDAALNISLTLQNTGERPAKIESAFHPYFAVSDIHQIRIHGLGSCDFLDKTDGMRRKTQSVEPLVLTAETDRVYPAAHGTCVIEDPAWSRRIVIEKAGSSSTIVWNPWIERSRALSDFGDDEWTGMVCVEQGNVGPDALLLLPGGSATLSTSYRLEHLES